MTFQPRLLLWIAGLHGIEPRTPESESGVLPIKLRANVKLRLVDKQGIEP